MTQHTDNDSQWSTLLVLAWLYRRQERVLADTGDGHKANRAWWIGFGMWWLLVPVLTIPLWLVMILGGLSGAWWFMAPCLVCLVALLVVYHFDQVWRQRIAQEAVEPPPPPRSASLPSSIDHSPSGYKYGYDLTTGSFMRTPEPY